MGWGFTCSTFTVTGGTLSAGDEGFEAGSLLHPIITDANTIAMKVALGTIRFMIFLLLPPRAAEP
jgi:hypothetical protein